MVRAGDVGAGGVAGENAFGLCKAAGDFAIVDREMAIDVVVVDERKFLRVTAALNDVRAAGDAVARELGRAVRFTI